MKAFSVLIVAILLCWQVSAISFYLKEGTKKCFLEDVPKDTLLVASFRASDISPVIFKPQDVLPRQDLESGLGIDAVATSVNSGEIVHSKSYGSFGRVAFTSREPGEHEICFSTNSSRWFGGGSVHVELELVTGAEGNDYRELQQMEQLTGLETFIRRLNDRVADVLRTQAYFNSREQNFRDASESVNARAMWFSFIQTIILLASGIWQVNHLKNFFRQKKIV